jgi:hypothetical protein
MQLSAVENPHHYEATLSYKMQVLEKEAQRITKQTAFNPVKPELT